MTEINICCYFERILGQNELGKALGIRPLLWLLELKCVLKYFEGMDNGDFNLVRDIILSFLPPPLRLGY